VINLSSAILSVSDKIQNKKLSSLQNGRNEAFQRKKGFFLQALVVGLCLSKSISFDPIALGV
jgi:hypothetical protein